MKPIPFKVFAKLLGGRRLECQTLIKGVAIDSRKVRAGDLFCALPGNRVDGHTFLEEVAAKGAVAALVREDYRGESHGLALLPVPDVLEALQEIARKTLEKRKSQVVAITGSLGKTTAKEFTRALLSTQYKVFASPLSYNTQATVPLSILMADGDEDILILEMGMTHPGQIEKLISIAPPDVALLTTVAVQHAINFSDGLTGIAREKGQIFSHPKTRLGILHRNIHHFDEVAVIGNCPKKTFSMESKEVDYFLEGVTIHPRGEESHDFVMHFPHSAYAHNFLAAAAVARAFDISWEAIQKVAPTLTLPAMRFERVEKQGITFINDAYNANPDAMKVALESLPTPAPGGKRIAVLSEMDALGMYSDGGHALVAEAALRHADVLLCLGERCVVMQKIWREAKRDVTLCESREQLEKSLKRVVKPGDVVLLKGARSYALDTILNGY